MKTCCCLGASRGSRRVELCVCLYAPTKLGPRREAKGQLAGRKDKKDNRRKDSVPAQEAYLEERNEEEKKTRFLEKEGV